jgi:predicted DNA-binding protein YlxM (UPF0122 family)
MARTRTKNLREEQLPRIAELHAEGLSQREIAAQFGLSQSQICHDLKLIYERWAQPDPRTLQVIKNKMLAEIAANKRVCRQAWRDSLKPKETISQKQVSTPGEVAGDGEHGPDRNRDEIGKRVEERNGNVAFLRELREYMAMECKIHGLDAAHKVEMSGTDGPPIRIIEVVLPASVPPSNEPPTVTGGLSESIE